MATNLPPLATLCARVDRFARARIVVWGDVVADRFLYGSTTRISREAPALVVRREAEETRPGGAGNAMMNAAALGARVSAAGFVGADATAAELRATLAANGIETGYLLEREDAPTPRKTRIMAGGLHTIRQQILRIDDDPPWPAAAASERLRDALLASLEGADALLVSDYGMGSVPPALLAEIIQEARRRGTVVVADSRKALLSYAGVNVVTPNEEEVEAALQIDPDGLEEQLGEAGARLLEALSCDAVLITRGSRGMALFEAGGNSVQLAIHGTDEIADVTGAGDAVIATLATALVVGATMLEAARLANVAAGLAVMKRGTATVPAEELRAALEQGADAAR